MVLNTREVAAALGGQVAGPNTVLAPGPGHSRGDRSLSVKLCTDAPGGFIVHSHAADDWRECRDHIRARLQLNLSRSDRVRTSGPSVARLQNDNDAKRINLSLRFWNQSRDPRGTVVERYLASRKLTLPDHMADEVVRFHPSLAFEGRKAGALVALFQDIVTNRPSGIHRTFLDADARKLGRKMLGRARGAAIKLDDDASVTLGLTIGEGLETCIAAWLAGFRPVWAVGSASSIANFPVLPGIKAITILAEVEDGGANRRAIEQCGARWHEAEREVLVVSPLVGKDLNDAWAA
jgi:putative DNA primase/helicase